MSKKKKIEEEPIEEEPVKEEPEPEPVEEEELGPVEDLIPEIPEKKKPWWKFW